MKDAADNKTIDAFEKKAMTNAERQRKYRESKKYSNNNEEGGKRLDTIISKKSWFELESLLRYFMLHCNTTKKEIIEKLIEDEYKKHANDLPADLFD